MTKQIRFEKWSEVKDAKGNLKESITSKVNAWAEVSRSSGDRSSLNGQMGLTNFFIFKIKLNPKFTPTVDYRIIYDGRRFTINSIEKEKQDFFYWIIKAENTGQ